MPTALKWSTTTTLFIAQDWSHTKQHICGVWSELKPPLPAGDAATHWPTRTIMVVRIQYPCSLGSVNSDIQSSRDVLVSFRILGNWSARPTSAVAPLESSPHGVVAPLFNKLVPSPMPPLTPLHIGAGTGRHYKMAAGHHSARWWASWREATMRDPAAEFGRGTSASCLAT